MNFLLNKILLNKALLSELLEGKGFSNPEEMGKFIRKLDSNFIQAEVLYFVSLCTKYLSQDGLVHNWFLLMMVKN